MTTGSPAQTLDESPAQKALGLRIKLFADGANLDQILQLAADPTISGFTTNPTLMRASGVTDYRAFARSLLDKVTAKPISFEVFADDLEGMYRQAKEIASWGANVYVKIPVTNTRRDSTATLVRRLTEEGVQVNVTAVFTLEQVSAMAAVLAGGVASVISIFAGRIADTGRDPVVDMKKAVKAAVGSPRTEVLWASPREILNLYQADAAGCHIITMTPDLLAKVALRNKDLLDYSLDTVKMFYGDAERAGYSL
jgi:transaldolase